MMASSHRLAHAIVVLETGEPESTAAPATPELQRFVAVVKTTLAGLKRMLRGQKITSPEMPDLRNDFRALLEAGDQRFYPYTLANIEGERSAIVANLERLSQSKCGRCVNRRTLNLSS
jgi:hypothetical protein